MKMMNAKILFVISILIVCCSSPDKQEKELLKEAAVLHNEMITKAEQLEETIAIMDVDSTYRTIHDSLVIWKEVIENWETDLVEVPGNEEHHHKGGEHHHEHQQLNVTPEQMLNIQKELHLRLRAIEERIYAQVKK